MSTDSSEHPALRSPWSAEQQSVLRRGLLKSQRWALIPNYGTIQSNTALICHYGELEFAGWSSRQACAGVAVAIHPIYDSETRAPPICDARVRGDERQASVLTGSV